MDGLGISLMSGVNFLLILLIISIAIYLTVKLFKKPHSSSWIPDSLARLAEKMTFR